MTTVQRGPLTSLASADPLGEALHSLRMNGAFYCRSELSAPWGMTLPPTTDHIWFHVVTAGEALLEIEGGDTSQLRPGDLALVPHGAGHVLRSASDADAPNILDLEREALSDRYEILRHGGGGASRPWCVVPYVSSTRPPVTWSRCSRRSSTWTGHTNPRRTGCRPRCV